MAIKHSSVFSNNYILQLAHALDFSINEFVLNICNKIYSGKMPNIKILD